MIPKYKREVAIALALAASAILTGCGSNSSSAAPIPAAVPGAVVGTGLGYSSGSVCLNQGTAIGFTATGMALDAYGDFIAGTIPPTAGDSQYEGQTFGALVVTPSTGLPSTGGATIWQDTNYPSPSSLAGEVTGTMMISVGSLSSFPTGYGYPTSMTYGYNSYPMGYAGFGYSPSSGIASGTVFSGYPYGGSPSLGTGSNTVSATGMLQLSQTMLNQIAYASMYSTGFNPLTTPYTLPTNTGSVCVTGMAFQGHAYGQSGDGGFQAQVYLYLNNTPHGYEVYFY